MEESRLRDLMNAVSAGEVKPDEAVGRLRSLPFEDLGFAKVDHHRSLRTGYPETIFCAGKLPEHVAKIITHMRDNKSNVLATRCSKEVVDAVLAEHPDAVHHELARAITVTIEPPKMLNGYVAVVCAGTSDIPVAEEALVTLDATGNASKRVYDVGVAGIHRLFEQRSLVDDANVVIVCAGMEGALASVVGGLVDKPVIAVPTSIGYGASFGGIAALLGMLNSCSAGVSVMNIDNGYGAGVFAGLVNRLANEVPPGDESNA